MKKIRQHFNRVKINDKVTTLLWLTRPRFGKSPIISETRLNKHVDKAFKRLEGNILQRNWFWRNNAAKIIVASFRTGSEDLLWRIEHAKISEERRELIFDRLARLIRVHPAYAR